MGKQVQAKGGLKSVEITAFECGKLRMDECLLPANQVRFL